MIKIYAAAAATGVAAMIGGIAFVSLSGEDSCGQGTVAGGQAAIGGPFTLVSETGETVTDEDVIDKPSLVYFGYTFCPDVCPFDAARNADAVELLAERGHEVKPVFVSVDPERDTPEILREFTDYMHPDMVGLTGSPEQVKAAANAYKVYYARQEGDDPDYYLMDHSVFTYLMLPDEGFAGFFRGAPGPDGEGVTAEEMAEQSACLIEQA
ncbi:SCO family protein [Tranquillimonas rosea]|uniref:SCO family protein n=1 Tax=Tranquillimonas rosea TaxID=641238 RepID=UPI003BA9FFF2